MTMPRPFALWAILLMLGQAACAGPKSDSSTLASAATQSGGVEIEDSLVTMESDGTVSVQTISIVTDIDSAAKTDLTILGVTRRSQNGSIQIRPRSSLDAWQTFPLPAPGDQIKIPSLCVKDTVNAFDVRVSNNFGRVARLSGLSLAILSKTESTVNIGHAVLFCLGSGCQKDDIITVSCANAKIDIR